MRNLWSLLIATCIITIIIIITILLITTTTTITIIIITIIIISTTTTTHIVIALNIMGASSGWWRGVSAAEAPAKTPEHRLPAPHPPIRFWRKKKPSRCSRSPSARR